MFFALLATLILFGCQTLQPDSSLVYMKTMRLNVNNSKGVGLLVVKDQSPLYNISGTMMTDADILKISTCHRYEVILGKKSRFNYAYKKVTGIEDQEVCLMEISGYDTKIQLSSGLIDFRNEDEKLVASYSCNGKKKDDNIGLTMCQSKVGLVQSITFDTNVDEVHSKRCAGITTKDNRRFLYPIVRKKCVYMFEDDYGNKHRHTSYGYDDIMVGG